MPLDRRLSGTHACVNCRLGAAPPIRPTGLITAPGPERPLSEPGPFLVSFNAIAGPAARQVPGCGSGSMPPEPSSPFPLTRRRHRRFTSLTAGRIVVDGRIMSSPFSSESISSPREIFELQQRLCNLLQIFIAFREHLGAPSVRLPQLIHGLRNRSCRLSGPTYFSAE